MILKVQVTEPLNQKPQNQIRLPLKVKRNLKEALYVADVEDPILNRIAYGLKDSVANVDEMAIK